MANRIKHLTSNGSFMYKPTIERNAYKEDQATSDSLTPKRASNNSELPHGLIIFQNQLYEKGLPCTDLEKICLVLTSDACPQYLRLNIHIGDEGAKRVAAALPKILPGLTLKIEDKNISENGKSTIVEALSSCTQHLNISLKYTQFGFLAELQSGLPGGLYIAYNSLREQDRHSSDLKKIVLALQSGMCPAGLKLNFCVSTGGFDISKDDIIFLAKSMQLGKWPVDFEIEFPANRFSKDGVIAIADALKSGNCPSGLTLDLSPNKLDDEDAIILANAIASGNCPQNLSLKLGNSNMGKNGINAIIKSLAFGPKNLSISLWKCNIDETHANQIAQILQSGHCPSGLYIDFSFNKLSTNGVIIISRALQSHHCPKDLAFNFYNNEICNQGAAVLASAIENNFSVVIKGGIPFYPKFNLYNQRNCLIRQYPQHENVIKQMCYERGYTKPNMTCPQEVTSLKSLTGMMLLNTDRNGLEKLPKEIQNFLEELDSISKTLAEPPQPIM